MDRWEIMILCNVFHVMNTVFPGFTVALEFIWNNPQVDCKNATSLIENSTT